MFGAYKEGKKKKLEILDGRKIEQRAKLIKIWKLIYRRDGHEKFLKKLHNLDTN